MDFFRLSAILFLTKLIIIHCCSGAKIVLVEDEERNEEEEDMAKAMAQRQTYIWRNIVKFWHCNKKTLKKDLIEFLELGSMENLIEFCENWKMMALTTDAYVKGWKERKPSWTESTEPMTNEKPIFLYEKQELLVSSAMTAIVLICQALLFKRGNRNYLKEIKIDYVNKDKCSVVVQPNTEQIHDLNKLSYTQETSNHNYLYELDRELRYLKGLIESENAKDALVGYKLWRILSQIGLDLNEICSGWESIETKTDTEAMELFANNDVKLFRILEPKFQQELGQLLKLYKLKVHGAKVKDPCEEAKLRVKKKKEDKTAVKD